MRAVALIASLVGLASSAYLTRSHIDGPDAGPGLCEALSDGGCAIALHSEFGVVGGVPVSVLAMGLYAALTMVALRGFSGAHARAWATVGAVLSLSGIAFGLFLLGVMAQARAYCPMCLTMDGCNLLLAIVWLPRALRTEGVALSAPPALGAGATGAVVVAIAQAAYLAFATPAVAKVEVPTEAVSDRGLTVAQCDAVELSALEISDFLCPYCKRLEANLSSLLSTCGARVDKRFVHFPLDPDCNRFVSKAVHPGACRLAEASECARLQGKFAPFSAGLFDAQPRNDAALMALARRQQLDMDTFSACLEKGTTRDRVRTDIELAHRLGVRSTPTFYLNGRRLEGALSRERLEEEIGNALEKDVREARTIQSQAQDEGALSSEPVEACDPDSFSQAQNGCAVDP